MTRLSEIRVAEGLLAGARAGDAGAQEQIYILLAPGLFALIRRIVGVRAVAEDLFQDTMMTLFERLPEFRGEAPLGAWLRRIAVSKCLMYLRSPWHRVRLQLENESEPEMHQGLSALITPAPPIEGLDVERALQSLPVTTRAVVWLHEVEGYSHEEIGRLFGRTVSFSKSQLARAHQKLREWFESGQDRQLCTSIQSNSKVL